VRNANTLSKHTDRHIIVYAWVIKNVSDDNSSIVKNESVEMA